MAKGAKNGEKNNIWHKRKRCWISLNKWIILITIGFIVVCLIFIYVGLDAAYLNFVGPLYIGLIAFFQDINFKKEEIERHKRSIQPILSVRIINKNNNGERNKILFEGDIIHYLS